jgi:hypothetical protein
MSDVVLTRSITSSASSWVTPMSSSVSARLSNQAQEKKASERMMQAQE